MGNRLNDLRESADNPQPEDLRDCLALYDALAARLAEAEKALDLQVKDCIAAIAEAQRRGARLAEAEALLRRARVWLAMNHAAARAVAALIDAFLTPADQPPGVAK